LTFAVIGGGPTGVELAGALAELGRDELAREYRNFGREDVRVVLFEAQDRLLPTFSAASSRAALRQLEQLQVEVRLSTPIESIHSGLVGYPGGQLPAATICWGSGVRAARIADSLGAEQHESKVVVSDELCLAEHPEVFAIGDVASCLDDGGRELPGLAPVALQQGDAVASTILADVAGEPRQRFRYRNRGLLATIGKRRAVAQVGPFEVSGLIAWLTWVVVHVTYLIGFRNRLLVLLDWAWCYLGARRGSRIVSSEITACGATGTRLRTLRTDEGQRGARSRAVGS
jgi:NADH dehydrogenase